MNLKVINQVVNWKVCYCPKFKTENLIIKIAKKVEKEITINF